MLEHIQFYSIRPRIRRSVPDGAEAGGSEEHHREAGGEMEGPLAPAEIGRVAAISVRKFKVFQ